ncbi:MAG: hypothetical protein MUP03_03705 [Anaerolineales bacterium]|nr:hypothetical protein [Anaerolineales bacterium]
MASTYEMFLAVTALIVNTFLIIVMYFVGNVLLAPIVKWAGTAVTGPQQVPMWDATYIIPAIWGLLLACEVVIIISFFIVVGRRQVIDDYY